MHLFVFFFLYFSYIFAICFCSALLTFSGDSLHLLFSFFFLLKRIYGFEFSDLEIQKERNHITENATKDGAPDHEIRNVVVQGRVNGAEDHVNWDVIGAQDLESMAGIGGQGRVNAIVV